MRHRLGALSATLVLLVACSGSSDSVPDPDQPSQNDSAGSTGSQEPQQPQQPGQPPPVVAPSDAGGSTSPCATTKDVDSCYACCDALNAKGAALAAAAYDACLCQTPGACAGPCAQATCAGEDPKDGDACSACVDQNDETCSDQADAACAADPDCARSQQCYADSQCDAKPTLWGVSSRTHP